MSTVGRIMFKATSGMVSLHFHDEYTLSFFGVNLHRTLGAVLGDGVVCQVMVLVV